MSETKNLSPVMQQYVDIKAEHPDAILMFRLGDFYEVFFEDAKIASAQLGLVLTHRGLDATGENIPMCGIPWHASDNYFGRLVRGGFNVALVEQLETPAQAKQAGRKFINRGVVRVLTPGTLTDENLLSPKLSNFLIAITPRENAFEIAGVDISTGEFFIGESKNIFDDLTRLNPAEIIYPESSAEMQDFLRIRAHFKTTPVYERLYLREDIGLIVSRVFGQDLNQKSDSKNQNVLFLLAGYLFNTGRGANIAFRAPYDFNSGTQLLIDSATWKSLEIDSRMNDSATCLLDVLDLTRTASGGRKLRAYLRTLSAEISEIRRRQEHIGHLIINTDVANSVDVILSKTPDVGRSLSRILSGRGTPRDLKFISDFLMILPDVKSRGKMLDADFAKKFENINTHNLFSDALKSAMADVLPTFFRDGGVIRDGFDISLDNMKSLSRGAQDTIAGLQSDCAARTGVSALKIKYNNILGYFIEVPAAKADALMIPENGFIHRQTMSGNMRFTNARLIELDNDVRGASERAFGIETGIINSFIESIREISADLLITADLIADLDVWCALSLCAKNYDWTRPIITDGADFEITGGRHPVIEYVLRKKAGGFVKNDCVLNHKSIALLTGPNMAGKSTYLRQNAMIVILAHLGSFVPASSAKIGICDQLFSRVGASDNLAAGQSTFMVEMIETANILNRATNKSFIILDEIGRGTSTYDGMAIAQSVLEFLDNLKPRTLFATHYHELTKIPDLKNVWCGTMDVREHNNEIIFMHKIVAGTADRSYGIHVAKMAGMPASVVARASKILESLEDKTMGDKTYPIDSFIAVPAFDKVSAPVKKSQLNLFGE